MEELHTDSIDGGHEGQLWARSRARERAYSNILLLSACAPALVLIFPARLMHSSRPSSVSNCSKATPSKIA
jgi:hypothetical protein